ncbi:general transcription factor II-I repeat domain-containing protein 2A [Octopus bimaculoides]|uniref:general transcription factor II-I repeat domain-containing protein 2A n=1 Tax=Octopus bimaculoides TaxID=37653 RepID=UPI00071CAFA9|nr:general transcription factor II-I repeat domain-containing protein 2A [Octopus bimaculoides]|eukprot:XP_014788869.1 PREDICTED: general transcription factor II-I repeat domain-containing protein 2A-like [Octopus bimaculoides]
MSLSKRRKVDTECRLFQEKWAVSYLFVEVNRKPVCLVFSQQISVLKEYNIWRHYETHHADKYNNLQEQMRRQKEALCYKSFKMDHVVEAVVRTANFIRTRGLNHRQFDNLLSDIGVTYGLPYHTRKWTNRTMLYNVSLRFMVYRPEIAMEISNKEKNILLDPL